MAQFSKLGVGQRLAAGTGVLLLLLGSVIAANIKLGLEADQLAVETRDRSLPSSQIVANLKLDAAEVQQWMTDGALVGLAGNPDDARESLEEARKYAKEFQEGIERLLHDEALDSGQKEAARAVLSAMNNLTSIGDRMISAYGKSGAEGNAVMEEFDKASDALIAGLTPLVDHELDDIRADMSTLTVLADRIYQVNLI
jgi:hypothetical protein